MLIVRTIGVMVVRKFLGVMATVAVLAGFTAAATPASAAPPTTHAPIHKVPTHKVPNHKINVLGEWAHPDDDTSIIGPCGVWHQLYGINCGIIQVTRGEGGGNAIGTETGPALGLRRENEDRAAHFRSGTADLFYADRVDFYYNQSAPLTQFFWNHDQTLARVTRIIRETQPDIYIGFTPTLAAGHGNHQQAGRFIWEGVQAAADPNMFPDQLTGPNALSTWQVKKVFSGGSTAGTGGTTTSANCTTGFVPSSLDTVAGVWTGYPSPYTWPAGNLQGQPAGTPKIWEQVAREGRSAYPTQSRTMFQDVAEPRCSRFGMTESFVPFQPNVDSGGTPNPQAGLDKSIFFGATMPDPGGLPKGTLLYETFSRFFNVAGDPFQVTVHAKSGAGRLPAGSVALTVPDGWTASPARPIGPISDQDESTATFTVTPAADATADQYKIAARLTDGRMSGYTDKVAQVVPAAEGRFQRWGKFAEYDQWLTQTAPSALALGRSPAVTSMATGETASVPVAVHNWSDATQSGTVALQLPAGFSADAASKPYSDLAAGADTVVTFQVTNTDTSLATSTAYDVGITTSYAGGSASETLSLDLVPATVISQASTAPTLDGQDSPGEYPGPALDLSPRWQGSACDPAGVDCGSSAAPGDPNSTYAKVAWNGDDLYFLVHVRDDTQSFAPTPQQCVAHWLTDSVEIQIDPRGNSSQTSTAPNVASVPDTSTTFKTGIFPFSNDPANTLGNAAPNGPCWERDADNHQGYSNGPLADTVPDAPNAPGMQVVSTAHWVGNNDPSQPHAYADGFYNLEVKIPAADLPAAIDPNHVGLNITPYDEDNQLHIDQSTRLGWSAWNSVQSDPYNWGHARMAGYTPPPGRSTDPTTPIIPDSNLQGVESPQTVYQSARNGVTIAGLPPAPASDRIAVTRTSTSAGTTTVDLTATGPGTARIYLWRGEHGYIPVYSSSCASDPNEAGFTPCAASDGSTPPPWGTDMGGHVVGSKTLAIPAGRTRVSIPAGAAPDTVLVSFRTDANQVQAMALAPNCDRVISGTHDGALAVTSGTACLAGGTVDGPVSVTGSGSFTAVGGTIDGPVAALGARALTLSGTTVSGPVSASGVTRAVQVSRADIAGPVALTGNHTGVTPIVVAGNHIGGPLACSGNAPPPTNQAQPNAVTGPQTGQCHGL